MWRISEQACQGLRAVPVQTHVVWRPGDHPANLRQESSPGSPQTLRGNGHKATQSVQTEQRLQVSEATRRGDQVACQMVEDEQEQALVSWSMDLTSLVLLVLRSSDPKQNLCHRQSVLQVFKP